MILLAATYLQVGFEPRGANVSVEVNGQHRDTKERAVDLDQLVNQFACNDAMKLLSNSVWIAHKQVNYTTLAEASGKKMDRHKATCTTAHQRADRRTTIFSNAKTG